MTTVDYRATQKSNRDKIAGIMLPWRSVLSRRRLQTAIRLFLLSLVVILALQQSSLPPGDQKERIRAFTRQIEFDYTTWMWEALWVKGEHIALGEVDYLSEADQTQLVLDYLALVSQIRQKEAQLNELYADPFLQDPESASASLRRELKALYQQRTNLAPVAEAVLQNQSSVVLAHLGLSLGGQPLPPLLYRVTPLPLALVVSPREVIRRDYDISLVPDLTIDQRVALEEQVEQTLDVSALVVNVGGVGMYPTMVMETTNLPWLAEVVAHEWVHNFLTLRPLGASYESSPEMRIINEVTANLAGKEIGRAILEQFYPAFLPPPEQPGKPPPPSLPPEKPSFDFRAEMHKTRLRVDELLAAGQVEEAEAYMEARRKVFWENGYRIRKLNQAYFAFHGAYADQPGGAAGAAEDPIGDAVRELRSQSPSLEAFLNRISWVWSWEQLQALVE